MKFIVDINKIITLAIALLWSVLLSSQSLRDNSNMLVGKIEQIGTVRDSNNKMIGKVESDGTVRDKNSMTVGYAKDIPETYAAVFFFFNLFE